MTCRGRCIITYLRVYAIYCVDWRKLIYKHDKLTKKQQAAS
jgi:hypothetical protein